jgi:hypothetical protein
MSSPNQRVARSDGRADICGEYKFPREADMRAQNRKQESKTAEQSLTIPELCEADSISVTTYYKIRAAGLGPDETRFLGAVRITAKARRDWHEKLRRHAEQKAQRLERQRRSAQCAAAGRNAVASLRTRGPAQS